MFYKRNPALHLVKDIVGNLLMGSAAIPSQMTCSCNIQGHSSSAKVTKVATRVKGLPKDRSHQSADIFLLIVNSSDRTNALVTRSVT